MGRFLRKEYIPTCKFKTNNEWLHHLLILNFINDDIFFKVTRKASEFPWLLDIKNKRCDASRLSNPPPVNTNSTPSEISNWKTNAKVVRCHEILFKHDSLDGSATFMSKIIDKVWPIKKKAPKVHIAYAISVCEFILNPKNKKSKYLNFQLNIKFWNI